MNWRVYGIIPQQLQRDHYEIEVLEGSSYDRSGIQYAGWSSSNRSDLGVCVQSWTNPGTVKIGLKIKIVS